MESIGVVGSWFFNWVINMLRKSWKFPANDPSAEVPDVVVAVELVELLDLVALAAAVAAAEGVTVLAMLMIENP